MGYVTPVFHYKNNSFVILESNSKFKTLMAKVEQTYETLRKIKHPVIRYANTFRINDVSCSTFDVLGKTASA